MGATAGPRPGAPAASEQQNSAPANLPRRGFAPQARDRAVTLERRTAAGGLEEEAAVLRPRRKRLPWGVIALALSGGLLLGGAAAWDLVRRDAEQRSAARRAPGAAGAAPTPLSTLPVAAPREEPVLWQSPTGGPPIDLRYLPSGSQMIVVVHPAALLASPEGARVWQALGPWAESWETALQLRAGVPLAGVATLRAALSEGPSGELQTVLAIETVDEPSIESLLAAWGQPQAIAGRASAWRGSEDGYILLAAANPRQFVVAPLERLDELLDQGAGPPVLSRELERLAERSDGDRLLSVLLSGGFLSRGGRAALVGEAPAALADFEALLGDDAKAASLAIHLDERLFVELRLVGRSATRPQSMAAALQQRIAELPERATAASRALETTPPSRELLDRLPDMLHLAARYTRVDVDDDQVVARTYLPTAAAHHLALAGQILLVDGATGSEAAAPGQRPGPWERRVTLRWPRTTLESALAELGEQMGAAIVIDGPALQRAGITRNQMFAVDLSDVPASEALEQLLKRASAEGRLTYGVEAQGPALRITVTTSEAGPSEVGPAGAKP